LYEIVNKDHNLILSYFDYYCYYCYCYWTGFLHIYCSWNLLDYFVGIYCNHLTIIMVKILHLIVNHIDLIRNLLDYYIYCIHLDYILLSYNHLDYSPFNYSLVCNMVFFVDMNLIAHLRILPYFWFNLLFYLRDQTHRKYLVWFRVSWILAKFSFQHRLEFQFHLSNDVM